MLKLYVITNVLCGHSDGMIIVLARTKREALKLALADHPTMSDYAGSGGMPDVRQVTIGDTPRVVTYMYGGD
jgi:hypothetical protein